MFNDQFNDFCPTNEQRILDFYPEGLRNEIDDFNEWILRWDLLLEKIAFYRYFSELNGLQLYDLYRYVCSYRIYTTGR